MPLSVGDKLGPYEIVAPIGKGGMGEVYRARDAKLKRDVALKVLPDAFARDPERMARFQREAELLASLNHPNIATIYGVEANALVMELVEGENLRGPLPIPTALEYAKQMAEALEYAHERGVMHRDLKPANVKVTPEGKVKLLDFGLAKAIDDPVTHSDPENSPTLTLGASRVGAIMGTAAYMSPEQASGKTADRRADIWSFGAVLYEMLAGKRAFAGESVSDPLATVLKVDPDWDALPAAAPASIRKLVRQCLKKDRKERLQAIGDARIAMEEALGGASQESEVLPAAPQERNVVPWAVAGALLVAFGFAGWGWWRATRPVDRPLMRFSVDLGPAAVAGPRITAAISPDGRRLVFVARGLGGEEQLATRLLDQANPTLLAGTDGAIDPFFSPDGQWIGFFAGGKMKKISVQGGAVVTLCDASDARGANWGEDGSIIFTPNPIAGTGLSRIPDSGGTPQTLTKPREAVEVSHRWPQILPGGQAVLFTATTFAGDYDNGSVQVLSLKTGQVKVIVRGGYFGRYLATSAKAGEVGYIHQGTLFGLPFDLERLEVRGTSAPLVEDVAGDTPTGGGQFDASRSGTLVYLSGKSSPGWPLVWLDSTGKMETLLATPASYNTPRLSPDGKSLAFAVNNKDKVYDWQRDSTTKLTFNGQPNLYPVWSPDGRHIVFQMASPAVSLQWIRTDGAGEAQQLIESKTDLRPYSFSPDGKRLAFAQVGSQTGLDIWTLPLDVTDPDHPKPGKPELFSGTMFDEDQPAFSPDGRWIAFRSNVSGGYAVFVQPFPGPGGKWLIGTGRNPIWSRDARELFYVAPDNRIMVASYSARGDSFAPDKPRVWSPVQILDLNVLLWNLDLAPDGKHFVVFPRPNTTGGQKGSVHVTVLLNFFDELRRRAPTGK